MERYEDRIIINSLFFGNGNKELAKEYIRLLIKQIYQPATPTFRNIGLKDREYLTSCFLVNCSDSMNSISRTINAALQLSKRGGGVGINLSDLRERSAPIKNVSNAATGVVPVMKILEDSFSYSNQLGVRSGAGVVWLHGSHLDILDFLDTKKENADEKIRIKTLSLGVILPDILFKLLKNNENFYMFSSYDMSKKYNKPYSQIDISKVYQDCVEDNSIRKKSINSRKFMQLIAELQFESGYPFIMFEGNVNKVSTHPSQKIKMSNLCTEILQSQEDSEYENDLTYSYIGKDISCNIGSMNIVNVMNDIENIERNVELCIRALSLVSTSSNTDCVSSIKRANKLDKSIGLGQMNLAGYFATQGWKYGDKNSLEFTDKYFEMITYYSLKASNKLAIEDGIPYEDFNLSTYKDGSYFDNIINNKEEK